MLGRVSGWRILWRAIASLSVGLAAPAAHAAVATNRFESEIRQYEAADRLHRPPRNAVLFVGSSSVRLWTNLPAAFPEWTLLNRGFGGSTMEDLLHFYPRIVRAYAPRMIVVYEGDNDLDRGADVATVVDQYRDFVTRVRRDFPHTPVALLAVKPSPRRRHLLEAQRQLNAGMLRLATERSKVIFVDTFTPILGADGEPDPRCFEADALHLNAEGYARWRPAIQQAVAQALGANSTADSP